VGRGGRGGAPGARNLMHPAPMEPQGELQGLKLNLCKEMTVAVGARDGQFS